ncbi:MAG: hypothetical protein IJW11_01550, partial [Clostridia bacterium]|nr:hypothetical protein [Clostridia bacterium]
CEAETAPSKELKERIILDAQRLCDGGGEPSTPVASPDSLHGYRGMLFRTKTKKSKPEGCSFSWCG